MFVSHPLIKRNRVEAREYQIKIAENSLKDNTLIVLPTGLGKTNIALLACAEKLNKEDGKILFLSPTKPLVNQHKQTFENLSEIGDLEIVSGEIKPEKRKKLYEKGRIIFATPQTIANDLKKKVLNLKDFVMLIVDEAHHTVGNYAYTYIAKRYMDESKNPLIIGMTASPGGKIAKIEEIKNNLFINQVEAKSEADDEIKKYVKEKEMKKIEVFFPDDYKVAKKIIEKIISKKIEQLHKKGALPTKKFSKKLLLDYHQFYMKKASSTKRKELYFAVSKISELMGIEGNIRKYYYEGFDTIINDFIMNGRSMQPPRNEVNSLISFGRIL